MLPLQGGTGTEAKGASSAPGTSAPVLPDEATMPLSEYYPDRKPSAWQASPFVDFSLPQLQGSLRGCFRSSPGTCTVCGEQISASGLRLTCATHRCDHPVLHAFDSLHGDEAASIDGSTVRVERDDAAFTDATTEMRDFLVALGLGPSKYKLTASQKMARAALRVAVSEAVEALAALKVKGLVTAGAGALVFATESVALQAVLSGWLASDSDAAFAAPAFPDVLFVEHVEKLVQREARVRSSTPARRRNLTRQLASDALPISSSRARVFICNDELKAVGCTHDEALEWAYAETDVELASLTNRLLPPSEPAGG